MSTTETTRYPRYFIDGRPAEVHKIRQSGSIVVRFDGAGFRTDIQSDSTHHWEPCGQTEAEIVTARAAANYGFAV